MWNEVKWLWVLIYYEISLIYLQWKQVYFKLITEKLDLNIMDQKVRAYFNLIYLFIKFTEFTSRLNYKITTQNKIGIWSQICY